MSERGQRPVSSAIPEKSEVSEDKDFSKGRAFFDYFLYTSKESEALRLEVGASMNLHQTFSIDFEKNYVAQYISL